MPENKVSKALKFNDEEMEVVLTGREENSVDAESRQKRVREMVAKMVWLGNKRGRPKMEEESNEEAA